MRTHTLFIYRKLPFGTKSSGLIIKGGLKIEGCKIEGLLYSWTLRPLTNMPPLQHQPFSILDTYLYGK